MSEKSPFSPALPWKTRLYIAFADSIPPNSFTRRLFNLLDSHVPPNGKPLNGVTTNDVMVDPSRNLFFRVFTPTETAEDVDLPVIIYFHGGGFNSYSADSKPFDLLFRTMACKIPAVVVSVNYRLAPKYRCPAPYEDGIDAIKYIDTSPNILAGLASNADLSRCFIAGDSAGGNIAHHVARQVTETKSDYKAVRVIGLLGINPGFCGEEQTPAEIRLVNGPLLTSKRIEDSWTLFLPQGAKRNHEALNVADLGPDISGLDFPATLVVVAGFDPLQDWQRRYFKWLKNSGKEADLVEYPATIHGFYIFPHLPETSQLISDMQNFIQKQLDKLK